MNSLTFAPNTRFFTISTAGHVDHGKTSLLRALTGIDPDRLKEEKERQMTTDLGFAYLELAKDLIVGFVDVPGHGKFLKNMLAGVGGIDMALLVVAADEGPMPQTRQHVRILSLLGIDKALVALTKIDTLSDDEHLQLVKQEVESLLHEHGIEMVDLVCVSSTKLIGLDKLKQSLERQLRAMPARDTSGGAFLPVDRVFSKSGFGTVITGTLVRGQLAVGDQVLVGPNVSGGRVRRLETHGHLVDVARAGQRVACNIVLKENNDISRGHVVLGNEVPVSCMLVVSVVDRPRLTSEKLSVRLSDQPIRFYHGTAEHHGFIRWAEDLPVGGSAEAQAVALVALNEPAIAQARDRFVLRLSDETIYGGEVIVRDRPRWMKRDDLKSLSEAILDRDSRRAIEQFIGAAPHQIVKLAQLSLFLPYPEDKQLAKQLIGEGKLCQLADALMMAATRTALSERLLAVVRQLLKQARAAGDNADSVALEAVRTHLNPKLDRPCFQALVDEESAVGKIKRRGDKISLAGEKLHNATDPAAARLQECIAAALSQNFCLDLDELARHCGSDAGKVKTATQAMARGGRVHLINYEFAISDDQLLKAHHVLADIWQQKRNIAPTDFREALNTTRKYAMALLQHFDDVKITRRLPSGRVLLKPPASR